MRLKGRRKKRRDNVKKALGNCGLRKQEGEGHVWDRLSCNNVVYKGSTHR